MKDKSTERLLAAKEALGRGDHKTALKNACVAISFSPSIEGFYYKAEANFLAGDLEKALEDIRAARDLIDTDEEISDWKERLEQTFLRIEGAISTDEEDGPPVSQTISVMVPSPIKEKGKALTKIIENPDLSTNSLTLLRIGQSVVYDCEFLDFSPEWIDAIIEMSNESLEPTLIKQIRKTAQFYHVSGPNVEFEQQIDSQIDLAMQFVLLLEPLVRTLEAPVALIRGSNAVVTYDQIRQIGENISVENLIAFYVKIMNSGDSLFSVGMHQLGYADVEIPFNLIPLEQAAELLDEFMIFQVVNNFFDSPDQIEYESTQAVYSLERLPEERFNVEGEARFNSFGVWHFNNLVE